MIKVDLEIWMDPPRYTEMVKRTVHFEKFDELPKKGDQIELYDLEPAGRFEVDRINKAYIRDGMGCGPYVPDSVQLTLSYCGPLSIYSPDKERRAAR